MRFAVRHETLYRYSAPVRLGEHVLRLTPKPDCIAGLSHAIDIEPAPAWRTEEVDRFGSPVMRLGFAGETAVLRIVSRFEGVTRARPPLQSDLPRLPWTGNELRVYLGGGEDPAVRAFAAALATEADMRPAGFFDGLAGALYARIDRHIRPDGDAHDPGHTLASGRGACRDLSVLFMAACRSLGVPSRFVSGYQARGESVDGRRHLHAWPEVWLPGVGWRGYDPTHGVAVSDGHVALAAAPDQAATMPVEGGFWGAGVTSRLDYRLEIAAG